MPHWLKGDTLPIRTIGLEKGGRGATLDIGISIVLQTIGTKNVLFGIASMGGGETEKDQEKMGNVESWTPGL